MFDFNFEGWTYGPFIGIVVLYFLWRILKPNRNCKLGRGRDFKTRYQERKKGITDGYEKEEGPKPYRERWNNRRKFSGLFPNSAQTYKVFKTW